MRHGPPSRSTAGTTDTHSTSPTSYGAVNPSRSYSPQRGGNNSNQRVDHVAKVRREVDEVKEIMKDNIEKVIERDEKVSILGERADNLVTQTHGFKENAKAVRKNAQRRNWKMCCCIATVVIVILAIVTIVVLYALKIL